MLVHAEGRDWWLCQRQTMSFHGRGVAEGPTHTQIPFSDTDANARFCWNAVYLKGIGYLSYIEACVECDEYLGNVACNGFEHFCFGGLRAEELKREVG